MHAPVSGCILSPLTLQRVNNKEAIVKSFVIVLIILLGAVMYAQRGAAPGAPCNAPASKNATAKYVIAPLPDREIRN